MNLDQAPISNPFARIFYLMAKPIGAVCNLRCSYCYYLEKGEGIVQKQIMNNTVLEEYVRQYIEMQTVDEVNFTWHGGEAMMRNLDFYERAIQLQQKYAGGRKIINCIQTNGTLLNDQWCRFLRRNDWLVGISIDGPEEFHDRYRLSSSGRPTHQSVMRAIRLLQRYGVEFNAMAVVNDYNVQHPEEFYKFFKSIGCRYIQFAPIVERTISNGHLASNLDTGGNITPHSITPQAWGEFLCRLFDTWRHGDVGSVFIQLFDSTLARWVGAQPGVCTMAPTCGHAGVIDYNGDVYVCDHFVFPQFKLGNILQTPLVELVANPLLSEFGNAKRDSLPQKCLQCEFLNICNGECPKNRFVATNDGPDKKLNYLCEGYHTFFRHSAPYFNFMAEQLKAGLPPAMVNNLEL